MSRILAGIGRAATFASESLGSLIPAALILRKAHGETSSERLNRKWRRAIFDTSDLIEQCFERQAFRMARRAVRLRPDHPMSHGVMGLAHHALRHYELAVRSFRRARELAATEQDSLLMRGLMPLEAGDMAAIATRSCGMLAAEAVEESDRAAWTAEAEGWFRLATEAAPQAASQFLYELLLPPDITRRLCQQLGVEDLSWVGRR